MICFRRDILVAFDPGQLKRPNEAIRGVATFRAGWFVLDPLGVPVSAVAAASAPLHFAC